MDKNLIIEEIKNIIRYEFSRLLTNIESDFIDNYGKKRRNFILNQMDEEIVASMVFVSSFESKSGNAMEACAKKIARLKYGETNVPKIINMTDGPVNIEVTDDRTQLIATNVDIHNPVLQGRIEEFMKRHKASGRRNPSTLTQEVMKELIALGNDFLTDEIHTKPVDLAFFDGTNWNIMEIKAGGDLDSSNAPSNVTKLLTEYTGMHSLNCKAYFSTLYNKDGEGNVFKGCVKSYLSYPDAFLIGSQLWNLILPEPIKFDEFCEIYKSVLEELDLNNRIKALFTSYETV